MTITDLRAVRGVPECALDDVTVAALPSQVARAPWTVTCSSITWYARGGRAAGAAAGPVAPSGRALVTIGGLVSYTDTPVGPYHEAFGTVAVRRGRSVRGTIPFMAVDSLPSLVGGRANWSLPKCLARFTGEPSPSGSTMTADGDGWRIVATARPFGPRYRAPMSGRLVQPWPDGALRESVLSGTGHARSAIVTVHVESTRGDLAAWLRPGRHLGAVLLDTSFTLAEPSVAGAPHG
jgi:Acetoacetate decarboxylase (ADC)